MTRYFNTEGCCKPEKHYMVRLEDRLAGIKRLYVDRGKYFVINRGRQYGKTTTLMALAEYLKDDYLVVSMDFQRMGTEDFADEERFVRAFSKVFAAVLPLRMAVEEKEKIRKPLLEFAEASACQSLRELFTMLSAICENAGKPMVLIIDEVDSASNNQVFVDFLSLLRGYYLDRENSPAFYSVILAGVYDIQTLKLKMRPDEEHRYNSPWNIAAKFDMDMSFSTGQIASMLQEYEDDCHTGMDVEEMAQCIYGYTSGYPYLVSVICKLLDEDIRDRWEAENRGAVWSAAGIAEAVKLLMDCQLPLFQSMMRQLAEYPELKRMLHAILFQGKRVTFNPDNPVLQLAFMFGYIVNDEQSVQVANRMFEMRLYNLFLSEEELTNAIYDEAQGSRDWFFCDGRLDMKRVLEKFVIHFTEIYGCSGNRFMEEYGRKFFLLYLKPIINGRGNYYIESQTRDARRTDVIVDYLGEQFIIELKIWRGNEYNEKGKHQLAEYLDDYHQEKGYLLSFNFNQKKEQGVKEIHIFGKIIIEAVV